MHVSGCNVAASAAVSVHAAADVKHGTPNHFNFIFALQFNGAGARRVHPARRTPKHTGRHICSRSIKRPLNLQYMVMKAAAGRGGIMVDQIDFSGRRGERDGERRAGDRWNLLRHTCSEGDLRGEDWEREEGILQGSTRRRPPLHNSPERGVVWHSVGKEMQIFAAEANTARGHI